MTNHFYAIIFINNDVGAHCMRPESVANGQSIKSPTEYRAHVKNRAHIGAPLHRQSGSIGSILAGFISATTKRINQIRANPGCPVWQRNYYERVIRNEHELTRAREYIDNNPQKGELDKENPVNTLTNTDT